MRHLEALCTLVLLSTFICSTQSASCCVSYTKRALPCQRLLGYNIQTINNSCDINAIIFHIRSRFVCADPLTNWTQRGMSCVDEKRKKQAQIIKGRTPGSA
ncbi:C-C motif chemokine 20b [Hippoglossus stenolepis]|uniref:C-C motif chemokine 20b n=1 Tax=Hippoglossus stenolepis TaxID=195615 RepID=UPI00159C2B5A|nr:C-C motif chemokine 20b [Hippoglossus stenolepis]